VNRESSAVRRGRRLPQPSRAAAAGPCRPWPRPTTNGKSANPATYRKAPWPCSPPQYLIRRRRPHQHFSPHSQNKSLTRTVEITYTTRRKRREIAESPLRLVDYVIAVASRNAARRTTYPQLQRLVDNCGHKRNLRLLHRYPQSPSGFRPETTSWDRVKAIDAMRPGRVKRRRTGSAALHARQIRGLAGRLRGSARTLLPALAYPGVNAAPYPLPRPQTSELAAVIVRIIVSCERSNTSAPAPLALAIPAAAIAETSHRLSGSASPQVIDQLFPAKRAIADRA
jgi:hypothetical protein